MLPTQCTEAARQLLTCLGGNSNGEEKKDFPLPRTYRQLPVCNPACTPLPPSREGGCWTGQCSPHPNPHPAGRAGSDVPASLHPTPRCAPRPACCSDAWAALIVGRPRRRQTPEGDTRTHNHMGIWWQHKSQGCCTGIWQQLKGKGYCTVMVLGTRGGRQNWHPDKTHTPTSPHPLIIHAHTYLLPPHTPRLPPLHSAFPHPTAPFPPFPFSHTHLHSRLCIQPLPIPLLLPRISVGHKQCEAAVSV